MGNLTMNQETTNGYDESWCVCVCVLGQLRISWLDGLFSGMLRVTPLMDMNYLLEI